MHVQSAISNENVDTLMNLQKYEDALFNGQKQKVLSLHFNVIFWIYDTHFDL